MGSSPICKVRGANLHYEPNYRCGNPPCAQHRCGAASTAPCGWLARLRSEVRTPEQRELLQRLLMGSEKKSMPFLLGVMNMLLHGIDCPNIVERNALSTNVQQIRDADRVDVVVTNPPFGGEEERGILNNFPEGMRTAETALLYFQYVMAMLKRPGGRCGIVLPNGFLFGTCVATEVKKRLLNRCNLHTIVRLPNGVFAPYTSIPTNLLFFEAGWWDNRQESERAWRVPVEQLLANDCNLDSKNPNARHDFEHMPPEQLVDDIFQKEQRILEIMAEIKQVLGAQRDSEGSSKGE